MALLGSVAIVCERFDQARLVSEGKGVVQP